MSRDSQRSDPSSIASVAARLARLFALGGNKCARIEQLISLAADREATSAEVAEIDAHAAECAPCRALRATGILCGIELRERPRAIMPTDLPGRLIDAIAQEQRRELEVAARSGRLARRQWSPRVAWTAGAFAAAFVAGAFFLVHPHRPAGIGTPAPNVVAVRPDQVSPFAPRTSTKPPGLATEPKHNITASQSETIASVPKVRTDELDQAVAGFDRNSSRHIGVAPPSSGSARVTVAALPSEPRRAALRAHTPIAGRTSPDTTVASLPPAPDQTTLPPTTESPVNPMPSASQTPAPTIVASLPSSSQPPAVADTAYEPALALKVLVRQMPKQPATTTVSMASAAPRVDYTSSANLVGSTFN